MSSRIVSVTFDAMEVGRRSLLETKSNKSLLIQISRMYLSGRIRWTTMRI